MRVQLKYFFIILLLTFSSRNSFAFTEENVQKKTLIIIGYADNNQDIKFPNFLQRPFYPEIGRHSENSIANKLISRKYIRIDENHFENKSGEQVVLYNANIVCESERLQKSQIMRTTLCEAQKERSHEIIKLINSKEISTYSTIIYLGHARNGLGLALGPFTPEYTIPLKFYNEAERGKIKTIFLASCKSQELYSYLNTDGINLIGTQDKLMWIKDLLPKVLTFLDHY